MRFDELSERFDGYTAELVRQALTLEEFDKVEIEELVPYFEYRAEQYYEQYKKRLDAPETQNRTPQEREEYLNILRRRWQDAEEIAHLVLKAETDAREAIEAKAAQG